jgi:hypothetical protein
MSNTNDIPTSLRLPAQLPLDSKLWVVSKEDLKVLGEANQLAYTYYKGLRVFCANEREQYEWNEPQQGDTLLLTSSFVYPNGIISNGIDYSNKAYNFILVKNSDQNNVVKYIDIDLPDVAEHAPPSPGQIISYLNSIPLAQRVVIKETEIYRIGITIAAADFGSFTEIPRYNWYNDKYIAIYDIVGIGKGILPDLVEENISLSYYQEVVRPTDDNIVRTIFINEADLPFAYTVSDVINYILALPENERTIESTTSKVNILIDYPPS